MKKVQILVVCHKPYKVFQNDIYVPIHVGRAISKFKEEMSNMMGDDEGDNISDKNPYFCELTAQYWAWKNIKDVEYIGLCHYRRYFSHQITNENIDNLLGDNNDVILCKPLYEKYPIDIRLRVDASAEDNALFYSSIKRVAPDYYQSVLSFFSKNKVIPYNMFVMKKKDFDGFAEWQFQILFDMEKYVRLSPYTRAKRIFGYYAETLLPIYCMHNNMKIKYDYVIESQNKSTTSNKFIRKIKDLYINILFRLMHFRISLCSEACRVGLRQDGIECLIDDSE